MSHRTSLPVRSFAAAASTATVLWFTVSPALAHPAPEPNYAGPGAVTVVTAPAPTDASWDPRQLAAGAVAGLVIGAGLMAAGSATRRSHGHVTA